MRYEAPDSLEGAVALLAGARGDARVLAGGTDLLVQMRADILEPELIVDIKRIPETRGITEEQRWGIPQGAGRGWRIYFKGGWRPYEVEDTSGPVTHQAGLLRYRNGERVALAVLTGEVPGDPGGYGTIEEIARLLLRPPPTGPLRWPSA